MHHANQNPLIQVLVWDQTPNKEGKVLMNSLRDPAFPAINQHTFFTQSPLGLLEVNSGGWPWVTPLHQEVTRIFIVLLEGPQYDVALIERRIPGTFRLNFKHFI